MALDPKAGIHPILKKAADLHVSDVHCMVGQSPIFRMNGVLEEQKDFKAYTEEILKKHLNEMLTKAQHEEFYQTRELDMSLVLPAGGRFRLNLFWEKGNPALAARYIPLEIPSLDDLLAPEASYDFVKRDMGLVLVTGPTGCGKSTMLASMLEDINLNDKKHIITLEDPVEFMYTPKQSLIAQRELGSDFLSFEEGLKHILRQDPDVILVGEMRNLETISAAITLAETGHLVFATLHTNSAPETIDRIVNVFPPNQQQQIRLQLAMTLAGVISQILIPKTDGALIAAHEVLVNNIAIANLIRESKTNQIQNVLYSSPDEHMN
ncbi:PilT/PilU family type 4a pilus ATPase, partial [Candidatus Uhrbacteria bacterium]|nr:PilT/PilU family type 4a pilus ATPase [Candidatus Uhrbacteria bacterium]MBD3284016.1 PilT/PilU family type 4a pilus ATPase [Candidatus Uhrbacteria bacterium]